jgi:hypothetical protein
MEMILELAARTAPAVPQVAVAVGLVGLVAPTTMHSGVDHSELA